MSTRRHLGVVLAATTLMLAACGNGSSQPTAVHTTGPPLGAGAGTASGSVDVEATLLAHGNNIDTEPDPRGTLIVGERPADYFWVQGLSSADADALAAEEGSNAGGIRRTPAPGMTQLMLSRGGEHRLIGARDGADPERIAKVVFDLQALPGGWRFESADANAVSGALFQPGRDPIELLTTTSTLLSLRLPDGTTSKAIHVGARAAALAGLLRNLEVISADLFQGEISDGQVVSIVGDEAAPAAVVILGSAPPDRLAEWAPQITMAARTAAQ